MTPHSSSEQPLVEQLTRLLNAIQASGRSILLYEDQDLLQSIVDAAAQIFGAAAASIALVDENQQALVFKVAYGAGKETLVGLSIPLDNGLAGYVVMTGQPISISDVQHDARFSATFAKSTGFVPHSILATPLLVGDRVIGVMEVLDKIDAASFEMQDMDLLGLFAHQAAIAINMLQQYDRLGSALYNGLRRLVSEEDGPDLINELKSIESLGVGEDLLAIAQEYNEISQLGRTEQRTCFEILRAFGRYARVKSAIY